MSQVWFVPLQGCTTCDESKKEVVPMIRKVMRPSQFPSSWEDHPPLRKRGRAKIKSLNGGRMTGEVNDTLVRPEFKEIAYHEWGKASIPTPAVFFEHPDMGTLEPATTDRGSRVQTKTDYIPNMDVVHLGKHWGIDQDGPFDLDMLRNQPDECARSLMKWLTPRILKWDYRIPFEKRQLMCQEHEPGKPYQIYPEYDGKDHTFKRHEWQINIFSSVEYQF